MRIAITLFADAGELDFAGPWEVLTCWAQEVGDDVEVFTIADSLAPVRAAKGLRLLPDHTWDDAGPIDLLLIPGGIGSHALEPANQVLLQRLRDLAAAGTVMTSVCTGSLLLAAAGLLRNRPATTHWSTLALLTQFDPSIEVRPHDRYVDDGDVVTAAGVTAGIDMALHLVDRFGSAGAMRTVRREIQYDPEPPT